LQHNKMKFYSLFLILSFNVFVYVQGQAQCPTAPSVPKDRRTDKSKLTIATFNAEWLFDKDPTANCPGTGCPWSDEEEAMKHLDSIAKVIEQMNADIVNIVEVENCGVLQMVINKIGAQSGYLPYLVKGTDTATGQNVGILTRIDPQINLKRTSNRVDYPIDGSKCGSSFSGSTGVSKHYYTTFDVEGLDKPLVLIGIHFLAFPDRTDRCVQREAQAKVISDLAASEAIEKDSYVVILGDVNDFDGTITDPAGNYPISQVLSILKNPFSDKESKSATILYNALASVSETSSRWSCWYDKDNDCGTVPADEKTLIDHILISPDLKPMLKSTKVHHELYKPVCNSFNSDHWPISIQLSLPKFGSEDSNREITKESPDVKIGKFAQFGAIIVGIVVLALSITIIYKIVIVGVHRSISVERSVLLQE